MKTPPINVTLDLSHHGNCNHQQSALLREITRDASVSALLESLGADTLEIRFGACDEVQAVPTNLAP